MFHAFFLIASIATNQPVGLAMDQTMFPTQDACVAHLPASIQSLQSILGKQFSEEVKITDAVCATDEQMKALVNP